MAKPPLPAAPVGAWPKRSARTLVLALVASAGAHLIGLESAGRLASEVPVRLDFPIAAHLESLPPAPPPATPTPAPPKRASPAARTAALAPASPAAAPPAAPPSPAGPALALPDALEPSAVPMPESVAAAEPTPVAPALETVPNDPPAPPLRPVRRALPERLHMSYAIQTGTDGFTAGRAEYRWQTRNGRYSLLSTTQAVGVVALFMSGRIVQVSEGRIDEMGLRPEQFWIRRSERRQESARFDWAGGRLYLGDGRGEFALVPQAQDLLSFAFHLALTADPDEREFDLWVTNGRRFKAYRFETLGFTHVEVADARRETLRVRGSRAGEGQLDVWLDLALGGLPLKIATTDEQRRVFMLSAESLPVAE